jgi:hypothetical protein
MLPDTKRKSSNKLKRPYTKRNNDYMRLHRLRVIEGYGGKCFCCGENKWEFLTIDHKNGNGADHRKKTGLVSNKLYLFLIRTNFPKDDYQLLCFNCNCARAHNNGICPHIQRSPLPIPVKKINRIGRLSLICAVCKTPFTRQACRIQSDINKQTCGNACKLQQLKSSWTPERRVAQANRLRKQKQQNPQWAKNAAIKRWVQTVL